MYNFRFLTRGRLSIKNRSFSNTKIRKVKAESIRLSRCKFWNGPKHQKNDGLKNIYWSFYAITSFSKIKLLKAAIVFYNHTCKHHFILKKYEKPVNEQNWDNHRKWSPCVHRYSEGDKQRFRKDSGKKLKSSKTFTNQCKRKRFVVHFKPLSREYSC